MAINILLVSYFSLLKLLAIASSLAFVLTTEQQKQQLQQNALVVIYIDSFPNWFLERNDLNLSGFKQIQNSGTSAEYLLPEFPTVSATNYLSVFTGLYPEEHGLIGDYVWDLKMQKLLTFNITSTFEFNWEDLNGEPLWISAVKGQLPISLYWWRSCPIMKRDSADLVKCVALNEKVSMSNGNVLTNMTANITEDIVNFNRGLILLYYPMLALAAQKHGPYSPYVSDQVEYLSRFLLKLQMTMKSQNLENRVDTIVMSGNGIGSVPINHIYFVDDFLDISLVKQFVGNGGHMWIYAQNEMDYQVYQMLQTNTIPHCRVEWPSDFPDRWHLRHAVRGANILIICDAGYAIYSRNGELQHPKMPSELTEDYFRKGEYGYDSAARHMKGIFMASGPSFKGTKRKTQWIRSVDVHSKLCQLLNLKCENSRSSSTSISVSVMEFHWRVICFISLLICLLQIFSSID